jgi:tetratricopeptide (TPR) repeat protein
MSLSRSITCLVLVGLSFSLCAAELSAREERAMAQRASSALKAALSLELRPPEEIRALILQERFAEFEALSKEYEEKFKTQPNYEAALTKLYSALNSTDPSLVAKLDAWVAKRPSYMSYGARGIYKRDRGYAARGTASLRETPATRIARMEQLHFEAIPDLLAAVKENNRFAPAYVALIDITRGARNATIAEKAHTEGVQWVPTSYYIRHAYIVGLQPRWGGDYSLMQSYTDGLERAARLNPRVWSLKGEIAAQLGHSAWLSDDYPEAIKHYTEALRYGDRLDFLKSRGKIFMTMKHYAAARNDFTRYLEYSKSDPEVIGLLNRLNGMK